MIEGIVRLTGKTGYIVRGDSLLVIYFLSDHEIVMIDSGEFEKYIESFTTEESVYIMLDYVKEQYGMNL